MEVSQLDNFVANIVTIAPRRLDLNELYRLHFEQVDWGLPVGAIASVGFIGAFRFFGVDKLLSPNFHILARRFFDLQSNKTSPSRFQKQCLVDRGAEC